MAQKEKFVAYLRVSTAKQGLGTDGVGGLGIDAQRETVRQYVARHGGKIIAPEFVEQESGKNDARPELAKAIERCELTGATLLVANLSRLSRDIVFLFTLKKNGVPFVAADVPEFNTLTLGVMASVAQYERELTSTRTAAAMQASQARRKAAIARGETDKDGEPIRLLGGYRANAADIRDYREQGVEAVKTKADCAAEKKRKMIESFLAQRMSLNAMAAQLNEDGIETRRKGMWTATSVKHVILRLKLTPPSRAAVASGKVH